MKHPFNLGILGGAGPRACVHFQQLFLDAWARETGAWRDSEFPRLIVDTQAFESVTENGPEDCEKLRDEIHAGATRLREAGAQAFVIPCFSIHQVWPTMFTVIDWIDLRAIALNRYPDEQVPAVMLQAENSDMMIEWANKIGPVYRAPDQEYVTELIKAGMGNGPTVITSDSKRCILGCSELSLHEWPGDVYDCLKESAEGLVKLIQVFG